MDADAVEIRVLGCLIEKQRTTPDQYPLSLNSLRLACNQSTNRDPVVQYDERTIRDALERLSRKNWVRLASGAGSRAIKYRHLFDEALGLAGAETSLLAVLPTALVGTLRQRRYGNVDLRAALLLGIGSAVGVQGGVAIAEALPEIALRRLFGVLLLVSAAQIAWRTRRGS